MKTSDYEKRTNSRRGFTIVEFMIATTVFGVVLMVVTFSIMHISKIYQRSINTSRTQAVARNIIENISQSLQYSNGKTEGSVSPTSAICIGVTKQFLYVLGTRRATEGNSVMTTRKITDPNCAAVNILPISNPNTVGQQLVPVNMRVSSLSVNQIPGSSLYQVNVKVAYGDDDVLCNEVAVSGSCTPGAATMSNPIHFTGSGVTCKPGAGSEFCAISELATTVQTRL